MNYDELTDEDYKWPLSKQRRHIFGATGSKFYDQLSDLVGSTVIEVGFLESVSQGGLTIDYNQIIDGKTIRKRVVLGYTDLGEWIEWQGIRDEKKSKKKKKKYGKPED